MRKTLLTIVVMLSLLLGSSASADVFKDLNIPKHAPQEQIIDRANVLSSATKDHLLKINKKYEKSKLKPQLGVVIVKDLKGHDLEETSLQIARAWKIGFSDTNTGALFFVSINDREMRTETSDQMAVVITDNVADDLNNSVKDQFQLEDYDAGVNNYLKAYDKKISKYANLSKSERKELARKQELRENITFVFVFFALILTVIILVFIDTATGGQYLSSSSMSSGRSSGGGSSGGGSSWGGGGFSGGGSSGSW